MATRSAHSIVANRTGGICAICRDPFLAGEILVPSDTPFGRHRWAHEDCAEEVELELAQHKWVLVSDEDPEETEVCTRCGAQRNAAGDELPRAFITGGWPRETCEENDAG